MRAVLLTLAVAVTLAAAPRIGSADAGRIPAASRIMSDRSNILLPKNVPWTWVNNDYFTAGRDAAVSDILWKVEDAHLGPKNNKRGFWPWYLRGQVEIAVGDLRYALWVFPNHPRALHMLEVCAEDLHLPSLPIAYYEKAIRYFPRSAYTQAQYGRYLVHVGEVRVGIERLEEAVRLDPDLVQARAWLSEANGRLGLFQRPGQPALRIK